MRSEHAAPAPAPGRPAPVVPVGSQADEAPDRTERRSFRCSPSLTWSTSRIARPRASFECHQVLAGVSPCLFVAVVSEPQRGERRGQNVDCLRQARAGPGLTSGTATSSTCPGSASIYVWCRHEAARWAGRCPGCGEWTRSSSRCGPLRCAAADRHEARERRRAGRPMPSSRSPWDRSSRRPRPTEDRDRGARRRARRRDRARFAGADRRGAGSASRRSTTMALANLSAAPDAVRLGRGVGGASPTPRGRLAGVRWRCR